MTYFTSSPWQTDDWQHAMKSMNRDLESLCKDLSINIKDLPLAQQASRDFALKVPQNFIKRMEKGNTNDPLLLQVLPQAAETFNHNGFSPDPLLESEFNPVPGLVHKYFGRVLLISHPSCAIHCRYCFRRHFNYKANTPGSKRWDQALNYIRQENNIHEVILSGGDPLAATDAALEELITAIAEIPHIRTLRIHTRLPIVMPERMTDRLLNILSQHRLTTIMVLHSNHAQELSGDCVRAIELIRSREIRLYNQSVLLKNINDSVQTQKALLERLYQLNIQAYYLHALDKVQGAEHFFCSDEVAQQIYAKLLTLLPGYMLPKLVREEPQQLSKTGINIQQLT